MWIYIYNIYIYIYIYIYICTSHKQGCIKLIKSGSYKIFLFQINAVLVNFIFINEFFKKNTVYTKY